MLYSKISCNVEESLSKMYNYGVYTALRVDFNAFVTVTNQGKTQIDGKRLYSDVFNNNEVISILNIIFEEEKHKIIGLSQTKMFSCLYEGERIDIVYSPIRYYENYYVYSVLGKKASNWNYSEVGIIDFITKVTYENVLLDKKIMQERTYLKNIFDSVNSYIITVDKDLKIISINKKISQAFKLDERCIGKKADKVIRTANKDFEEIIENVLMVIKRVLEGETIDSFEKEIDISEEEKKYINISISKIVDINGVTIGATIIGNDISPLKIYEKENEQLKQHALLGEISAYVAHDIKNPLMSIRSTAQLLKKRTGLDNLEYLEAIVNSSDRINKIIEQLLAYSKISTEIKTGQININEVLEECVHAMMFNTIDKKIEIRKFFASELPKLDISMIKLQQIFMNILLNSMQSIKLEGKIDIITQVDNSKKEVVVIIKDTGEGMDNVDTAFQMFYTTKKKGTGLGLSIVKKVILELKGRYKVISKKGNGTVFYIWLPYITI